MSITKMHLLQCIVPVVRGLNLAVVGVCLMLQGLIPRLYEAEHLVTIQLIQQHHHDVSVLSLVTISLLRPVTSPLCVTLTTQN